MWNRYQDTTPPSIVERQRVVPAESIRMRGGARYLVHCLTKRMLSSNANDSSGTAHFRMFDRDLIELDDDLQIMVSRQANDQDSIRRAINKSGRLLVPPRKADHPHHRFVR
jgi:hypothetical protein